MAQLNNIGFKVEFMDGKAKLMDSKGNLVGFGRQTKGNLFYLDLSESSCFIAQVEESWLWHKRLSCELWQSDQDQQTEKNKRYS